MNSGSNEQRLLSGQPSSLAAQLRQTLNAIPAYTWYAAPSGGLTFVNERTADYIGLPKDHPLRLGTETDAVWDAHIPLLHPDDQDESRKVWSNCLRTGSAGESSFRVRNAQGGYRWFVSRAEPLRASDGTLLYWIGVNLDIEERKQAEFYLEQLTKALRKSEEELRQILDLTPQLIAVFGPDRQRLYINRIALDYFGVTLEEWLAAGPGSHVHANDSERLQSGWLRALSTGSPFEIELRLRKADGNHGWFLARFNPVRRDEGQVLRWYCACTDIEDRKRAEERLQQENAALREEINQASMFEQIVGSSKSLQRVLDQVSKVALTDSTVLVLGETGTGKELIARAIHKRSKRAARAFIGVNCGAIPASLIASELFGHEKGAFTGATHRHAGRFEAAHGGTLFLDEVGDLPADIQIALLRVLQEREIERVGGDKPIPVDVRVLAATHRDLEKLVSEGTFRRDLFYRLNVVPITVPPLRERAADIPVLVEYFIARFGKKVGKKFRRIEKKSLEVLQTYEWPGNVRELQNVIERTVILSDSDIFAVDEAWLKREPSGIPHANMALSGVLLAQERDAIEAALAQSRGRVSGPTGAAAKLGVPTTTLDSKIKRLGIDKYRFKSQMS
jgi:formate hydrogenlyase transcriptional activator